MSVAAWSACLVSILASWAVGGPPPAYAEEQRPAGMAPAVVDRPTTVYVEATSSTWRSRGRVSFQVVPSVRMKLQSAGFAVVQDRTDPHDLILKVDYREERGNQFRIDLYETEIALVASLEHPTQGRLLRLTVRESSGLNELGNAPYLQVLQKLETNPYFYFLGDIIRGHVLSRLDTTGALIEGLQRLGREDQAIFTSSSEDREPMTASTLPTFETHYTSLARVKTIHELGRLRDPRAVPVLIALLEHADRGVRLASVRALESIHEAESSSALERVAEQDTDHEVRAAAKAALTTLPGF